MLQHLPPARADWSAAAPTAAERALVAQFIEAHERCDAQAAAAIAAADVRITMPPQPLCFTGPESILPLMGRAAEMGMWRLIPVAANRMPAAASYLLRPGDTEFRAFKFDVIAITDGQIAEITTFDGTLFPAFGLDPVLG